MTLPTLLFADPATVLEIKQAHELAQAKRDCRGCIHEIKRVGRWGKLEMKCTKGLDHGKRCPNWEART